MNKQWICEYVNMRMCECANVNADGDCCVFGQQVKMIFRRFAKRSMIICIIKTPRRQRCHDKSMPPSSWKQKLAMTSAASYRQTYLDIVQIISYIVYILTDRFTLRTQSLLFFFLISNSQYRSRCRCRCRCRSRCRYKMHLLLQVQIRVLVAVAVAHPLGGSNSATRAAVSAQLSSDTWISSHN